MMNIKEYFNNLYLNVTNNEEWDRVADYENSVYEMEEDAFEAWAKENNIDLTAMGQHEITILQYWVWDMEE